MAVKTARKRKAKPDPRMTDPDKLHEWIERNTGLFIPRKSVCPHHAAPFDYIWSAYQNEEDLVVWAPRGGGKTTLGALATLLDMIHKPGCQVRILGGSLEQSLRMWEHLLPMIEDNALDQVSGKLQAQRVRLTNGSGCAVLSQSQRSVRGQRIQRMRCDEVELFDREVWSAAQLVTRSRGEKDTAIRASIEALSTMHEPHGLMQEIVQQAESAGRRVIKWCLLDVLEKCVDRECPACGLKDECDGKARFADGFMRIDDALAMKRRVCRETWEAEMLCLRPSRKSAVFPQFKREVHVSEMDWWNGQQPAGIMRSMAVDFGYRNPFVCLWVLSDVAGRVYVMDEYLATGSTLRANALAMKVRYPGFRNVYCDPAGNAASAQTSRSDVEVLRQEGFLVYSQGSKVQDGIDAIKAAIDPALEQITLRIHPRCKELIRSMECYHYKKDGTEKPDKDGQNDHCVDALRYFYIGRPTSGGPARCY